MQFVLIAIVALIAGTSQQSGATPLNETNVSPILEEYIRANSGEIWALSRRMGELRIETNSLPEHSWITATLGVSDRESQKALIDPYVSRLRDVFLRSRLELEAVNAHEIGDLAIVCRCAGIVVDHLRELMARTSSTEAAKRYLQSYIGVLTVLQSNYNLHFSKMLLEAEALYTAESITDEAFLLAKSSEALRQLSLPSIVTQ